MQFSKQQSHNQSRESQVILGIQRTVQWSAAVLNGVVFVCLLYLVIGINKGKFENNPSTIPMVLTGGAILMGLSLLHFLIERILVRRWFAAREKYSTDTLTGGMNRAYFEEIIDEEIRRSSRYHSALSLCCLDLDNFRSFNESFGTEKANELLRKFSDVLRGTVRFTDAVARYENDEFCALLPHTDLVRAEKFINRALAQVQEQLDQSFCAGLTTFKTGETRAQFMMRARLALHHAKSEGKKRVRCIIGDDNSHSIVNF